MLNKILFLIFFSVATLVQAEEQGYELLTPTQPVERPDKIEVKEFFMYSCPHCYHLEPHLNKWLAEKPENVNYVRQAVIFNKQSESYAKAYFIAEALGIVDKIHGDFFDAFHIQKKKLQTEAELAEFFIAHGVDKEKFHETYQSFLIDSKVRQTSNIQKRYGLRGVPLIVVNGQYKISSSTAGSQENMIKVLKALIVKETKK